MINKQCFLALAITDAKTGSAIVAPLTLGLLLLFGWALVWSGANALSADIGLVLQSPKVVYVGIVVRSVCWAIWGGPS